MLKKIDQYTSDTSCRACEPWCNDGCKGRGTPFSFAEGGHGNARFLSAVFRPSDLADPESTVYDDAYARDTLAAQDRLIGRYGNWNLVFKAQPYGVKDFMIIVDTTNGSPVVGIEDLSERDLSDLIAVVDHLRSQLRGSHRNSNFVFGLNRGKNQSLKRIHIHVADMSEAVFPPEKISDHIRARVASNRRPFHATKLFFEYLQQNRIDASFCNSAIRIPLSGDVGEEVVRLKELGEELSRALEYFNGKWGAADQWSYSMIFEEIDGKKFVRVAFFDRPVGVTDLAGVALVRSEGEEDSSVVRERRLFGSHVGGIMEKLLPSSHS